MGSKKLKFAEDLIPLILSGQKTTTWRFFDDKNLQVGDDLMCLDTNGKEIVKAKIISVYEKKFKDITDKDFEGHEKFANRQKMLEKYQKYYGQKVNWNTTVKIINFKII